MPDKNLIKKVLTYKAGNFRFSRKYDREKTRPPAHPRPDHPRLGGLPAHPARLVLPAGGGTSSAAPSTVTAAIEGNPLAEERVGELLTEAAPRGLLERSEREILNLKFAYQVLAEPVPADAEPFAPSEAYIQELNQKITRGLGSAEHSPGQYRDHRVQVGDKTHGGVYTPPKAKVDITKLMAAFVDWLDSPEVLAEPTEIRAALAHYHLGLIHPFGDGNGRAARLLEAAILTRSGMRYVPKMLSNFYYRNMDEYFIAFRSAEKSKDGDLKLPFLELVLRGLLQSMEELQKNVHAFIRILTFQHVVDSLRQSYELTQRQHDLLSLLIRNPKKIFMLKDLLTDPLFAAPFPKGQ
jgi:Fic family protein